MCKKFFVSWCIYEYEQAAATKLCAQYKNGNFIGNIWMEYTVASVHTIKYIYASRIQIIIVFLFCLLEHHMRAFAKANKIIELLCHYGRAHTWPSQTPKCASVLTHVKCPHAHTHPQSADRQQQPTRPTSAQQHQQKSRLIISKCQYWMFKPKTTLIKDIENWVYAIQYKL